MLRRSRQPLLNQSPASLVTTVPGAMHQSATQSSLLSPYAAALKQIAIKGGKSAFGPSAVEEDLRMSRAGALPADYRPPPTTAWDDTIERWAYAWQFPVAETMPTQSSELSKHPALDGVRDIAKRLLEAPPSKIPQPQTRPKVNQLEEPNEEEQTKLVQEQSASFDPEALMSSLEENNNNSSIEEEQKKVQDDISKALTMSSSSQQQQQQDQIQEQEPTETFTSISASEFQKLLPDDSFLPIAYLDDGSEFSKTCRELGTLMVEELDVPFDNSGVKSVIAALSKRGLPEEANAIFRFALEAGFEPSNMMYSALMLGHALQANTQECHDLIEEMKESGITPDRGTWHTLMIAYSKADDNGAILQIVENMKSFANIEPDETTFAMQLRALSKDITRESNVYEAVQLFDQMENVYGFIANRSLYHALLSCLCKSRDQLMVQKLNDVSQKMELLGIPWDLTTYAYLLRSCTALGDVDGARRLCAKMRNEGLSMTISHLSAVVRTYTNFAHNKATEVQKETSQRGELETVGAKEISDLCEQQSAVVDGIAKLVKSRNSWMRESSEFIDAVMGFYCMCCSLIARYVPDNGELIVKYEEKAKNIWMNGYDGEDELALNQQDDAEIEASLSEQHLPYHLQTHALRVKSAFSYNSYIAMLASQQRIDEAENLFQQMTMVEKLTPVRQTYEHLITMHLTSGEEGSSHRALSYMDSMTKSGLTVRPAFLKRMRRAAEEASYRRDMKRRMRRIVQAREEYLARKEQESERQKRQDDLWSNPAKEMMMKKKENSTSETDQHNNTSSSDDHALTTTTDQNNNNKSIRPAADDIASITPFRPDKSAGYDSIGTVQTWWKHWENNSLSKHELFDDSEENPDGTPAGETFDEKNKALRKLGINSKFLTKHDLPNPQRNVILNKIRVEEQSQPAAALWALDDDTGSEHLPQGNEAWGTVLWRERQIIRKELEKIKDGLTSERDRNALTRFSSTGNSLRTAPEQLEIENTGAKNFGELQDAREFPNSVYDDGTAKPASEHAASVGFSGELVWQSEKRDPLAPFKETSELYPDIITDENAFMQAAEKQTKEKVSRVIDSLQNKTEDEDEISETMTKRGSVSKKTDFLEKWRTMYRQGVLEMKDEPLWDMKDPATNRANAMRAAIQKDSSKHKRAFHSLMKNKNKKK